MTPLIRLVTLATLPTAVLISMTHLVGADQGPGDGFTGGIISSLGFTLQYVSFGYRESHRMFRQLRFERVLIFGLALALLAAVLPVFAGAPFLAIQEVSISVPLVGVIRLTRAMLFDFGIYFVVLGGAMTAIDSLGRGIE